MRAAATGRSLTRFIEDALREAFRAEEAREPYRYQPAVVAGRLLPGVDVDDRDALYEVMEGRR